jgi:hypothetical protein
MDRHFLNGRQIVLDDEEFMEGSGYGADCCWRYGLECLGCSLALNEHKMFVGVILFLFFLQSLFSVSSPDIYWFFYWLCYLGLWLLGMFFYFLCLLCNLFYLKCFVALIVCIFPFFMQNFFV